MSNSSIHFSGQKWKRSSHFGTMDSSSLKKRKMVKWLWSSVISSLINCAHYLCRAFQCRAGNLPKVFWWKSISLSCRCGLSFTPRFLQTFFDSRLSGTLEFETKIVFIAEKRFIDEKNKFWVSESFAFNRIVPLRWDQPFSLVSLSTSKWRAMWFKRICHRRGRLHTWQHYFKPITEWMISSFLELDSGSKSTVTICESLESTIFVCERNNSVKCPFNRRYWKRLLVCLSHRRIHTVQSMIRSIWFVSTYLWTRDGNGQTICPSVRGHQNLCW